MIEDNENELKQSVQGGHKDVEGLSQELFLEKPNWKFLHDCQIHLEERDKEGLPKFSIPKQEEIVCAPVEKPRKRWYKRKGHWCLDENAKYYLFLKSNLHRFRCTRLRRLQKIFRQMSIFITTRSANQCRSHHQKQQKKYNELDILMINLYELTKTHPLLMNQPPFQRKDYEEQELFEENQLIKNANVSKQPKKPRVLVIYQMPESLHPISQQRYRQLFCSNKQSSL